MPQTHRPISEFMTANPTTIAPNLTLDDARERMYVNNIRHLVVVDGTRVVGVLSTRDLYLISSLSVVDSSAVPVGVAMASEPYTCNGETPLMEVAAQMQEHRYGCVVVVDQGAPVGIFTTTDAMRVLRQTLENSAAA